MVSSTSTSMIFAPASRRAAARFVKASMLASSRDAVWGAQKTHGRLPRLAW